MSPEQRASVAELARLRAEIVADRLAMTRCLVDIGEGLDRWNVETPDRAHLALAAVALHGWYSYPPR
jgi:hypothetical protein